MKTQQELLDEELKEIDIYFEEMNKEIPKLAENPCKEINIEKVRPKVNPPAEKSAAGLALGNLVKFTERGKIFMSGYRYFVDLDGIFYINRIEQINSYLGQETLYEITQGARRLSFYNNQNDCLENASNEEVINYEKIRYERAVAKTEELREKLSNERNYNYQFSRDVNEIQKYPELRREWWKDPALEPTDTNYKFQQVKPRGHALTKVFR